ncbi:DGC domain-containing protein [Maridesulfovibrio ferrireducens]|uniref:DGC domain-containing protein n=1 Tax=Maridesulfovibrio ferrireducens TaxID=246191 RepID=A0A1G9KNB0_9BACT|nr:putative zinc-binding protein [Maridesulfovibrio ferrireducens]SDL51096.1 DGC domain-containing protein [Maridesulfovibrio ferrireducens]
MLEKYETGFLVVACSGASKAGQAANGIAVKLDESGFSKMICLAAIGAGVDNCITMASNVQDLIIIDGCEKKCACKMLEKAGLHPVHEFCLTELGFVEPDDFEDPELIDELRKKIKLLFGQRRAESKYSICGCETCPRK